MEHIAVKVHKTEKGAVLGACDPELLGKKLRHGETIVEIKESFYFEKHVSPDELAELISGCVTANLMGKRAVDAYCTAHPGAKEGIRLVGGVPHLLVFSL